LPSTVRIVYDGPFDAVDVPEYGLIGEQRLKRGVPVEVGESMAGRPPGEWMQPPEKGYTHNPDTHEMRPDGWIREHGSGLLHHPYINLAADEPAPAADAAGKPAKTAAKEA